MKVAIIGSGVSGLAATWALNEFSDHEVHLYEADNRPGGHANTVTLQPSTFHDSRIDVDTGFIVLNPITYTNFLRFLRYTSIDCVPTEMTFSVSRDGGRFEWGGSNLRTFLCQPLNFFNVDMWRMLYEILRFNACSRRLLVKNNERQTRISIGEYLKKEGYSTFFSKNYLIPMIASIWSTPPDICVSDFPSSTLVEFFHNHRLLQLTGKPSWLTIKGGSHKYVQRILSKLPEAQLHLSSPVASVSIKTLNGKHTVMLTTTSGQTSAYDHIIIACHSDEALKILNKGGYVSIEEERILSQFRWKRNKAVLHCDSTLMPKRRLAWSCWNYLSRSADNCLMNGVGHDDEVILTCKNYSDILTHSGSGSQLLDCMNHLQHIPEVIFGPVLVTLNPPTPPDPDLTYAEYSYDHPIITRESIQAQHDVVSIQGVRGISFAGAYLSYGFHEDGFTSGLRAASSLGALPPFPIQYPNQQSESLMPATIFEALQRFGVADLFFALLSAFLGFCRLVLQAVLIDRT